MKPEKELQVGHPCYMQSSNFAPQVKQARNLSQTFNRKSISHNIAHRQSLQL